MAFIAGTGMRPIASLSSSDTTMILVR